MAEVKKQILQWQIRKRHWAQLPRHCMYRSLLIKRVKVLFRAIMWLEVEHIGYAQRVGSQFREAN